MAYVDQPLAHAPSIGCVFCDKAADHNHDDENLIVYRGQWLFVLLNLFPYNNGHLMVAPYQHTASLADLNDEASLELVTLTRRAQAALHATFHPDGYNLGMNLGTAGGAGIADHLHLHIVPRWNGDTNFMPVLADVKVLPDALTSSATKIRAAWPPEKENYDGGT